MSRAERLLLPKHFHWHFNIAVLKYPPVPGSSPHFTVPTLFPLQATAQPPVWGCRGVDVGAEMSGGMEERNGTGGNPVCRISRATVQRHELSARFRDLGAACYKTRLTNK